jgi:hypothetical protein
MRNRRSTGRGLYLPASFRPRGLVTLSTVSSLRSRAGFLSHRQRSWDSPFGAFSLREAAVRFRIGETHVPFLPRVEPPAKQKAGPAGHGSWVLPLGSPWRPSVGLAPRPLAAPLGLALRGFALGDLDRDFARSPLSRFAFSRLSASRPAPQSVDRSPPASARHPACSHVGASGGTLRGFPHLYGPAHSNPVASRAIFFTSHRVVHYCRPTDAL